MRQNLVQKFLTRCAGFRSNATIFVFFLLITPAAFAQGSNDLAPVPGELEQAGRRSSRKFFIGGFTANGLSWFGSGIQFSSKLAASVQWQEQRMIQRFDLDLNGVQSDLSGIFTLTNSEKIQRQLALQMEWFPFSGPYYFAAGGGLETYSEKQRKTEAYFPSGNYKDYAWNISQQKLFLSAGAGFRYIFTSGFFIHVGGNILFYPERGTHEQRGSYNTNTNWDYRQLQKDWQEPEKEAISHQNPYGAQLQILFGIAI